MPFEVDANMGAKTDDRLGIGGRKRIRTSLNFLTRSEAQEYADDTNKHNPGAEAKVVIVEYERSN